MLKTVDVGLMANHLSAHKAVIQRLELYLRHTQNKQISIILDQQIGTMRNHVNVMNQLLDPNQQMVTLPPIPQGTGMTHNNTAKITLNLSDRDIAIDAHFTASSMAKENFNSSENMKNKQVKKVHSEMALQQSTIAERYEDLMNQLGWMNQPNASLAEQTSTIAPLNTMPNQQSLHGNQQFGNQSH